MTLQVRTVMSENLPLTSLSSIFSQPGTPRSKAWKESSTRGMIGMLCNAEPTLTAPSAAMLKGVRGSTCTSTHTHTHTHRE